MFTNESPATLKVLAADAANVAVTLRRDERRSGHVQQRPQVVRRECIRMARHQLLSSAREIRLHSVRQQRVSSVVPRHDGA